MGWEEQQQQRRILEEINDPNNGGLFVKVMTDEQIEALRKQIAVYATICEQLVDLHRSLASPPDLPGVRFGNMYYDPSVTPGGHKLVCRQRWIPTQLQLQILELIFEQGDRKPGKLRIKEITSELSQHGQITETNVAYWFQNRRSRTRRKQHLVASNSVESEKERRIESPKEENTQSPHDQTPRTDEKEQMQRQNDLIGLRGSYDPHYEAEDQNTT